MLILREFIKHFTSTDKKYHISPDIDDLDTTKQSFKVKSGHTVQGIERESAEKVVRWGHTQEEAWKFTEQISWHGRNQAKAVE